MLGEIWHPIEEGGTILSGYLWLTLAWMGIGLGHPVAAAVIDDFSAGPLDLSTPNGGPIQTLPQSGLDPTHVIGGARFVTFGAYGFGNAPGGVQMSVVPAQHEFNYHSDPGISAVNFALRYGIPQALGADLTADGSNALVMDFSSADLDYFGASNGYFDVFVSSLAGSGSAFVPVESSAMPFHLVVPFHAFNRNSSTVDFSAIDSIVIGTANGNLFGDFTLTEIHTVRFGDGDYNYDGVVDHADYDAWSSQFGHTGTGGFYPYNSADGNRDAVVNAADYTVWRDHLGQGSGNASAVGVPEPRSVILAAAAALALGILFACAGKTPGCGSPGAKYFDADRRQALSTVSRRKNC